MSVSRPVLCGQTFKIQDILKEKGRVLLRKFVCLGVAGIAKYILKEIFLSGKVCFVYVDVHLYYNLVVMKQ